MKTGASPLRLSIDATALANPVRTGIGRALESLLPELVRLAGDQSRIRLFSGGRILGPAAGLVRDEPNLDAETVRFPSLYAWQQFGMGRRIRAFAPTVHLAPEGLLPLGLAVPAVGIVHDLLWLRYPETCKPHVRRVYRWRFASSLRRLAAVQYDSTFTRAEVDSAFPGVAPAHAEVVPLGVSASVFHPPTDEDRERFTELRRRHPLPASYLLTVGNLRRHKNLEVLLVALKRLHASGDAAPPLVVVGAGELSPELEALRRELPDGAVELAGYLDEEALRLTYQQAELFIFPSVYEGFGLPLLEAMAAGAPVAYARAGALPEVAGDAGLGFEPRDPDDLASVLRRALSDAGLRADLSRQGLRRAAGFSWRQTAEALWSTLERTAHEAA